MTSYDDMKSIIEEWFAEHCEAEGHVGVAKVYAAILVECEKQLNYFFNEARSL